MLYCNFNCCALVLDCTAEGSDRGRCARDPERDEVVRESRDGEAGDPDVVGRRCVEAAAAGRRRARAGRGVLVRRRLPQSPQATHLGTST